MSSLPLSSKTCLVTGAAGGLGKAIAQAFLVAGAQVVACDVNGSMLSACASELESQGTLLAIQADITDESAIEALVEKAVSKFGKLDILVNNAGIVDRFDPVGELDRKLWDKVIAVNLTAPYALTRLAVRHMLQQTPSSGVILNIGSLSSFRGATAGAAYTASKHGLLGLTKNTAASYAKHGIRCNMLMPGAMHTNISSALRDGFNQDGMASMRRTMGDDHASALVDINKLARMCVQLCSDDAINFNGATITVDNGVTCF